MTFYKWLNTLILLQWLPVALHAQHFRNLNITEGLPNSIGKCFAQDGQGFIWIGTFNGLARYDGFRFTTYRHADGDTATLAGSHVESLCYDGKDGLWVGTRRGIDHLSLADRKVSHCRYIDGCTGKPAKSDCYIWQIARSGQRLWAVNAYGTLMYKDADSTMVWRSIAPRHGKVKAVSDFDGRLLLVLSEKSLSMIDGKTLKEVTSLAIPAIDNSYICNLYYSHNQHLVFAGFGYGRACSAYAIEKMNGAHAIRPVDMPLPSHVKAVTDYGDMTLFATDGQGLKAMRHNTMLQGWTPQHDHISGNAVHSLFVDRQQSLWMGTYREGICVHSPRFDIFTSMTQKANKLSYNAVSAISADTSKIYIGTDGGGLDIYDRATKETRSLNTSCSKLPGNNITSLLDDGNHLWIGIYGAGIAVMDKRTKEIRTLHLPEDGGQAPDLFSIWQVMDDNCGHILFCGKKLYSYDKLTQKTTNVPLPVKGDITLIAPDSDALWIIHTEGLLKMDMRHLGQVRNYQLPHPMNAVSLYAHGTDIFVSTQNGGLYKMDARSGKWSAVPSDKLKDKEVESIQPDGLGNLWLATDNGLLQYDMEKGTIRSYGQDDNLSTCQYLPNAAFCDGRFIYLGAANGMVMFQPHRLDKIHADTKAYFDELYVLNDHKHIPLWGTRPKALYLEYDQNFFTIRFSVPELLAPHKIAFRYKLEGLDKEWREMDETRDVSYTNVPPGHYTLFIQATNSDGTWSNDVSELAIHISRPWYASWWALLLWMLIASGIAYAVFRHYAEKQHMKHEIEKKEHEKRFEVAQKEQEKEHELAQKELEKDMIRKNNEDKLNFFADVTHELRTPMFLITAPLEELLSSAQRPVHVPYSYLRGMYRNALRLNRLVNSILSIRKMETGDLKLKVSHRDMVKVCKRLTTDYRALCQQKDIAFVFDTTLEVLGADVDIEKLELIISNLVANAYKYTQEGGTVTLCLQQTGEMMQLTVSDNGIGIAKENQARVFERYFRVNENSKATGDGLGLAFVKSLVNLHHGNISMESELGKGTSFVVTLPLSLPQEAKENQKPPAIESDIETEERDEAEMAPDDIVEQYQSPTATQSILIIDDERETVQLLRRYLGKDYKIHEAGDGEAGLQMALDVMPDLVICDVMMPKMDGFEFLSRFKEDKKLQHIPVIMFTAKILDEDKIEAFRYGADAYITKPVSLKYLRARIESFLQTRPASLHDMPLANAKPGGQVSKEDQKFILRCREIIDENMHREEFNVDFMAARLGMSHSSLYKKVKAITGKSVVDMIVSSRLFRAVEMFRSGETNMSTVAERCGFSDLHSFRASFKSRMGMSPKQFVQQM